MIPDPIRLDRVIADDPDPRYVTFVNPQPEKGTTVFARIALELGRRRPDIPLLVVEGRGTSDGLAGLPVDLSGLTNLNRMANTPDPRDFYRLSRAILLPSLWRESLGRVAIEAMANGIPVLASDRRRLARDPGRCRVRVHDPRAVYGGKRRDPDPARGCALGGHDRAALGRPAVRGETPRPGQGRGSPMGPRPGGRTV